AVTNSAAALLLLALAGARGQLVPTGGPAADGGPGDAGSTDGGDGNITDAGPGDAGFAWQTARVALHVHSAISHDACDGHSKDGGALATLDQACLHQLKDALCATKLDVALLTDHPAHMDERPFLEDLLYEPQRGETLVDGG